ncbi:hypothetical protein X739_31270 [Mesorhizobium sp. LNHC220B00]|nr:hypothetical protein X739_31270 [Mesorhizobium sp. LNHC220B00]
MKTLADIFEHTLQDDENSYRSYSGQQRPVLGSKLRDTAGGPHRRDFREA